MTVTGRRCLVVDDSRTLRAVLRRILEPLGFAVSEAEDGLDALRHCRREMPEVVFVDWNMPNMDGLAFVRALRSETGGGRPVVIFCTSVDEIARIEEALAEGADEYIMKPFDREIVRLKLEQTGIL